ncbi:MAG TPA: GNAT family N-acetyltransferase [Chthoniobacterales bacterium]|jgi:GNAT superfamily N-acetyltransferase
MDRSVTLSVSTAANEGAVQELRQNLVEYNFSCAGPENYLPLSLILRDISSKLVAGLAGKIYYQWLFVELLWVSKDIRGHGHGRNLLSSAEDEARRQGCHQVWLDTFSFQAPGFYQKNGYTLFGELSGYPPGHQRYFFRKMLAEV